jgi:iron complex transport system ATP-binding protein
MSAAEPFLEVHEVSRRYGALEALAPTSFAIRLGEIVALVGANGSGKSTLLRAVVGGLVADETAGGRVTLRGHDLADREQAARVRAFVPQRPELSADFTAREVVELGRFARGADPQAVVRALEAVGLTSRADRAVRTLSGGERQRVAIARALAQVDGVDGAFLALDEPFAGIDPGEVARIARVLRNFARRGAVLLSLHEPGLARAIATRAIVLRGGRVLADGPAQGTLVPAVLTEAYGHGIVESASWLVPELPST